MKKKMTIADFKNTRKKEENSHMLRLMTIQLHQ